MKPNDRFGEAHGNKVSLRALKLKDILDITKEKPMRNMKMYSHLKYRVTETESP